VWLVIFQLHREVLEVVEKIICLCITYSWLVPYPWSSRVLFEGDSQGMLAKAR
jgi:hypothetical protein